MAATREAQPLLPLGGQHAAARSLAASASPVRGHLLSFESGFPSLVDEDEFRELDVKQESDRASERWTALSVLLTLLMSAIGSGTLSVPYTLLLLTPTQAVVTILLVGLAMAFTADVILRVHVAVVSSAQHEEVRETYQELAYHAGGHRIARLVSFLAGFAVFGACVGCVRVVKDMAPSLISIAYLRHDQSFDTLPTDDQEMLVLRTVWIVFMAVVLPLGFFKKISVLRYSSYLGFMFCLYLVGAVVYRSIVGASLDSRQHPDLQPNQISESFFSKLSVAIGIYNFTYMLHLNVIPLFPQAIISIPQHQRNKLHAAESRMSLYIYAAIGICAALYAIFGVCAASIYGQLTQGNILLNLAHDPIMAVPRVMILFTILLSFPLLFHPLRCLVLEMQWCCGRDGAVSLPTQITVSIALMVAQLLVATRVPGVQVVFSFVGSSILLILCYVMPTVFYMRLYPWRSTTAGRVRMFALLALLAVATIFCSAATIQLIVQ